MGKRLTTLHEATDLLIKWQFLALIAAMAANLVIPDEVVQRFFTRVESRWARRREPADTVPPGHGR